MKFNRVRWAWAGVILMVGASAAQVTTPPSAAASAAWKLVWSDEFNGPKGTVVDGSKWVSETGGGGWGNHELESYTSRLENASQQDGNLVIKALREKYTRGRWDARDYTSARLKTQGKFSQAYGRFEARVKIPRGQGIWPAFWMLGNDIDKPGWPDCGEIDIMENIGKEPTLVHGTIHGPGYSGANGIGGSYGLPGNLRFADDFQSLPSSGNRKRSASTSMTISTKLAPPPTFPREPSGCTTIHSS